MRLSKLSKLSYLLLVATACQQAPKADNTGALAASAASTPAPSTASEVKAPAKAWFEGPWQGSFQAELFRIEVPTGGVKEWKQDDGKPASGEGKLSLEAAADGSVTGTAQGALGELTVAGRIEGDRAALTLSSAQPDGFHGVLLANQVPEGMKGTLNASSADSLRVRTATVTLARANR